jgi:hypothetical protein
LEQVTFDRWNGSAWVSPVAAVHVSGGWRATGLALPAGQVRARGRTSGGQYNASSGIVEQITTYAGISNILLVDELGNPLISEQGTLDFGNLQVKIKGPSLGHHGTDPRDGRCLIAKATPVDSPSVI